MRWLFFFALLAAISSTARAQGSGLTGQYYDTATFGTLKTTRTDATINFNWGTTIPAGTTLTNADTFSVAWSGQVEAEFSELYTFYLTADDGARLWIDDRLVALRTFAQGTSDFRGQVWLTAGQRVNIRIEYLEQTGSASVKLEWSCASRAREVIPTARLYPARVDKAGGSLLKEHWSGLAGTTIGALTGSANYPNKPGGREFITSFECLAQSWADGYGTRVTGYLVAPVTGSYTFAVSGDEVVELHLSTDATAANKALVASVASATAFRAWGAPSVARTLTQGVRYYVEMLHTEGTGSDHWSVGWRKPGDAAFSVIPGSALLQPGLTTAQPAQTALLDSLAQEHPRIFATAERFAALKAVYLSPTSTQQKTWAQNAINSADTILTQAAVTYSQDVRGTILSQARTVVDRMYKLGVAWQLTGNSEYAERAWTELSAVAAFADWHPAHFLDTAEMTHGCAIGYDWFYQYWTPARRTTIRTAIINKGLTPGLSQFTSNVGWTQPTTNNWNMVCTGGLTIGALAVGTESETIAEDIIHRSLNSTRPVWKHFTTENGAWFEGPGYWGYTTEYGIRFFAALEGVLGSDFGISSTQSVSQAGFAPISSLGPTNIIFNFGDAGAGGASRGPVFQWFARRYGWPVLNWWNNQGNGDALSALWYQSHATTDSLEGTRTALEMAFHGDVGTAFEPQEMLTLRGKWNDSRTTFVACKGGDMGVQHSGLDAGTFVLDALGKRWFHDLGGDNYALPNYFSTGSNPSGIDRWDYYRNRPEGQNTLTINPSGGADMVLGALAPLIAFQTEPNGRGSFAIHDLTPVYSGLTRAWRGYRLMGNRDEVLVQDEIQAGTGKTVWWFGHFTSPATTVTIEPDGTAALMQQGNERLWCKIVSGGGTFQILDAVPLGTSPNPAGQNANAGHKKLAINLAGVTNTTLAVWFVPLSTGEATPTTLPAITAMNTWNIAEASDPPLATSGTATLDGENAVDIDLGDYVTDDATPAEQMRFSVSGAVNGTVVLLADGHTARFTPNPGYTGVPQFTFTATDTTADPRMVLAYDFDLPDASSGTVVTDVSGNGRDGTLDAIGTGVATFQPSVPAALGRNGRSLDLAENGDANAARLSRVVPTTDVNLVTSNWTIAGWFNRRDSANEDMIWHTDTGDGFGSGEELHLVARGTSTLELDHYPGPDVNIVTTAATPGVWHHFAVVRSGTTISLYLNGALVGTDSAFTLNTNQTAPLIFGGHTDTTATYAPRWFDGKLDELAVFNAALSAGEVATLAGGMTVRHFAGLSTSATLTLSATPITHNWNSTTSGDWSTGTNWQSGNAPAGSRGATVQFFNAQALTTGASVAPNNNLAGATQLNALVLGGSTTGTVAVNVTGGPLHLLNNGNTLPTVALAASSSGFTYNVANHLTLGATTTFAGTNSGRFIFEGNLDGPGGLRRTDNSSTLILAGMNSYQGPTAIDINTLQIGNDGATGTLGSGDVVNHGLLRFDRTGTLAVPNSISGSGQVRIDCPINAGTIELTGSNDFAGNVTIQSGYLRITNGSALGTGAKTVFANNGTSGNPRLYLDGSTDPIALAPEISFQTSNAGGVIFNEAGDNIINGDFTLTGGGGATKVVVSGGSLELAGQVAPSTTGRSFDLGGVGVGVLSGTFTNGGTSYVANLSKVDAGTWTLAAGNTSSGTFTIGAGTLIIGHPQALGHGGNTLGSAVGGASITAGATLDLNGQQGVNEVITARGTGVGANGAIINRSTAPARVAAGLISSISTTAGGVHGAVPAVTITGGGGSGATATATLGLSAASFTIAGGTTVYSTAPTVTITGGGGTAATATAVLTGGVVSGLTITNAGTGYTAAPSLAFSGGTVTTPGTNPTGTGNATNFLVSGIAVTNPGNGYTTAPSVAFSSGAATTATANLSSVTLGAATTIGGTGDLIIDPAITGGFALTKTGPGTVTLNGANTYTGSTTVAAGALRVNGSIAGSSASVAAAARLTGTGSVGANTTLSGTLAPGDGVGAMAFTGPLGFGSSSRLEWELTGHTTTGSGSAFDRLNAAAVTVTANAAIDVALDRAGSLVDFSEVFWTTARSWLVINATSVSGTFAVGSVSPDRVGRPASAYGTFTVQNAGATVNLVWTPFPTMQQWKYTHFLANWSNPTVGGDLADPDLDGRNNLKEYLLATDPNAPNSEPETETSIVADRLNLSFTRDTSHTDLTITVEGADVLGAWTPLARSTAGAPFVPLAAGVTISETGAGTVKSVQVSDAFTLHDPAHPRRFLRVFVQH